MLCRAVAGKQSRARRRSLICPPQTRARCEEAPCPLPRRALPFFFSPLKKTQNNKPSSQLLPSPEAELQGAAQGRAGHLQLPLGVMQGLFPPYSYQK